VIDRSKPDVEVGPTGPREKRPKRPVKRKPRRGLEGDVILQFLRPPPPPAPRPDPPDAA
jgi:hypothetical protein